MAFFLSPHFEISVRPSKISDRTFDVKNDEKFESTISARYAPVAAAQRNRASETGNNTAETARLNLRFGYDIYIVH
jgi:hypothetical protein